MVPQPRSVAHLALGAVASLALLVGGCSSADYVAPPPTVQVDDTNPAAAAQSLASLQRALVAGDGDAASALAAGPTAATLLADVTANVGDLRLSDLTLTYVTETGRTGDGTWEATVAVTWRIDGFDSASARVELPVTFTEGGRRITAIGGTGARVPLWLTGRLTVRRMAGIVVASAGGENDLRGHVRAARRALVEVREVVGGEQGLVVEVPADAEGLQRALGAERDQYASIAAVTAPVDGSQTPQSPVHIFLNPQVYDALDRVATQVVMTHEAVHALTGAALHQSVPLWVLEGFADYVALRDVDLPQQRTAAQIIDRVQEGGLPDRLPAVSDFDPTAGHLGAIYESAWLVWLTLAERRDEATVVAFYTGVLEGATVADGLRRHFDWDEADLVAAWRERLAALAAVAQ